MNFVGLFFLAVAIVLQIIGCHQSNADDTDIKVVLRNGFEEFNSTAANAERIVLDGLDVTLEVVDTNNSKAQETILNTIEEAQQDLYKSGAPVFYSVGKATSICSDARQSLVQISNNYSTIASNIINAMRTGTTLATQGVYVGGDAAKQLINGIRKDIQSSFGALYKQIPILLQQAIQVASDCKSTSTDNEPIQNSGPPSNNTDAEDTISELNEAAANAIQNGSDASKVTQLRDLLISSILDLADIASYGRIGFENFKNTVDNDESSAKKSFSEVLETVNDREVTIFSNICLDFGVVGAKDNYLSKEQLQDCYIAAELGYSELVYANMLVKNIAFTALQYQGDVRQDAFEAVKSIGRYGKMAFMKRIVEAGKNEFNIL